MKHLALCLLLCIAATAAALQYDSIPADKQETRGIAAALPTPTGAAEFEVERARTAGKTVHASDFGVSTENKDNTAAVQRALTHCRELGACTLLFEPGTYRMENDFEPLRFFAMRDFVFDGNGAKFVFLKKGGCEFLISNCERIELKNFSVDWDWERDPLGSLVEVAGRTGTSVDFRFVHYKDFPRRDVRLAIASAYDPATKSVGIEDGLTQAFEFFAGENRPETQWLSGNVLRVKTAAARQFRKKGLYRMQHYYYDTVAFSMMGNRHLTLENIEILSCPGHALLVSGAQQYWQFQKVRIAPPENDEKRVITCTADHCHIAGSKGFFKMEDCEFSFGADDCLNAHDSTVFARKIAPDKLRIERGAVPAKGAVLELREIDYTPAAKNLRVVHAKRLKPWAAAPCELTLSAEIPTPKGDGFILFDRTFDTRNIILRRNYFHDNRARGVLILCPDVTIENNVFRHNEMGALKFETGYTETLWCEGYGISNVVVRGNVFDTVNPTDTGHDGMAHDIYIGVYLKSDPSPERTRYPILRDFLFENNRFRDTFGLTAFISSAQNVTFRGNIFENRTVRKTPLPFRAGFFVTHAQDIAIVGNFWRSAKNLGITPQILLERDLTDGISVFGNRLEMLPETEQKP